MHNEVIDLYTPEKKPEFVPFRAHRAPVAAVLDLCSPSPKLCTVVSLLSSQGSVESDESDGDVLINEDTVDIDVPYEEAATPPASPLPLTAVEEVATIFSPKTTRRNFFANLDAKKRLFEKVAPPSAPVVILETPAPVSDVQTHAGGSHSEPSLTVDATVVTKKAKTSAPRASKAVAPVSTIVAAPPATSKAPAASNSTGLSTSSSLGDSVSSFVPFAANASFNASSSNGLALPEKVMIPLTPGVEWEVVLIVDKREQSNPIVVGKLVENNIPCELSNLAVGDFLWIARPKQAIASLPSGGYGSTNTSTFLASRATLNQGSSSSCSSGSNGGGGTTTQPSHCEDSCSETCSVAPEEEEEEEIPVNVRDMNAVVLDCIAERKSLADLASSIMDRRYEEQKVRLRACGVRSCLYIVEGEALCVSYQRKITGAHIKTAMVETHAEGNMHVLKTRNFDHTIECLKALHWQVVRRFRKGGCGELFQTFPNFQKLWGKKSAGNHRQLFGQQLRQLQGCSKYNALPIVNAFGSTHNFVRELERQGKAQAVKNISNMMRICANRDGKDRRIGKALAERIWNTYMEKY